MSRAQWNRERKRLEKQCSGCRKIFPATAEYFTRAKQTADGLYHQCKTCKAEVAARWRAKNPDYHKQWKAENPKRVKILNASYRENHRIELRHKNRLYNATRREEITRRNTERYNGDPEAFKARTKEWAANNRGRLLHNKKIYHQQTKDITPQMRQAAGELYKRDVMLSDGTLARVVGRDGNVWIVRLYDPIKIGYRAFQRIVRVKQVYEVQR